MKKFRCEFLRLSAKMTACAICVVLTIALAFTACSGGDDNPAILPLLTNSEKTEGLATNKTIYKTSGNLSDYTAKVLKALGCKSYTGAGVGGSEWLPDFLVLKGSEVESLTDDEASLVLLCGAEGKTVIIDGPSASDIVKLGQKLDAYLEQDKVFNKSLKMYIKGCENYPRNIVYQLVSALSDEETENNPFGEAGTFPSRNNAIGVRGNHVYYSHDTDEDLLEDSVSLFANWAAGSGAAVSASRAPDVLAKNFLVSRSDSQNSSSLNDLVKAQSFTHSYSAVITVPNLKQTLSETLEVTTDVWTACNIGEQKDYYLVRTSVSCPNQDIICKSGSSKIRLKDFLLSILNPYLYSMSAFASGVPYFCKLSIQSFLSDKCSVRDCKPENNMQGSDSFTTGTSATVSDTTGNSDTMGGSATIGLTMPSGTFSYSHSWTSSHTIGSGMSQSSTRSIPDVNIGLNINGNTPLWTFSLPYKDSWPLDIQKRTAVFDTYAVYVLPSDVGLSDGTVELKTCAIISFSNKSGTAYESKPCFFDDHIKKPVNSFKTYKMSFEKANSNASVVELNALEEVLEKKCKNERGQLWYGSAKCCGVVCGANGFSSDTEKENRKVQVLNLAAKEHFSLVKEDIVGNKNVYKRSGFKGKYTFYIQPDAGETLDQFEVDFGS